MKPHSKSDKHSILKLGTAVAEKDLVALFGHGPRPAGLQQVVGWSNGPHAVYAVHDHPYGKVLVVAEGSITFTVGNEGRVLAMKPGDRFDLPPHMPHSALVGPDGVVCLEAHIPPTH